MDSENCKGICSHNSNYDTNKHKKGFKISANL